MSGPAGSPAAISAWHELLATLARSGAEVTALATTADQVDVAEGLLYVLTVLSDQLERGALRSTNAPAFLPGSTPVRKLFFDNPDTDYDIALLDGARRYRVCGTRGSTPYLAFCVYAGNVGRGEPTNAVNLNDRDLVFAPDGTFELTLSATPPTSPDGTGGARSNWLPLRPGTNTLIARNYFLDRRVETPATYTIEPIDLAGRDRALDGAAFAGRARAVAGMVQTATTVAIQRAHQGQEHPNRFVPVPGHGLYGTPDASYAACWYDLPDDAQMLVIDSRPPACPYWGLHLANRWGQSLDHRTRTTAVNAWGADTRADGSLRAVVAARDPGVPNWLDTAGHRQGWVLFRWLLAGDVALPRTRIQENP